VLTVCGSLQQRSTNRLLLDVAVAAVAGDGEVTVVDFDGLRDLPAFDPDLTDVVPRAVEHWFARLAEAGTVLFACPEYAGALAGSTKNALDWAVGASSLYRKPVAVMSAGTSGGAHALAQMVQTLTWQGAHVVGTLGVAAPRTKLGPDGTLTDPDTRAAVAALARRLVGFPELAAERRMASVHDTVVAAGIDPVHIAPFT